ncbi:hypothetical protein EKO27_g5043 [Xylaria grammica]|uniref:DUF6536 domain-containing protein n=1 Tax=Xylaria grammica TaxID=363999 RepID=A0A439D6P8_9PEZI|nr:hypothetical protein EKO27_g5043 [Xylaria grammica]
MHTETKSFFSSKKRPAATGWRQSAKVNCAVLLVSSVALAVLAIVVLARSSLKPVFFYAAECDSGKVATRNLALHILINIVSTLVVLNAPTRQEVDEAHFKSSWLGIGVPSVRNAFRVSPFKTMCWISLFLSSVPIHLLFNSAIFEVDRRESDFHLTIATEEFLHGGDFYPPGSSLAIPGLLSLDDSDLGYFHSFGVRYGYGYPVKTIDDYKDHLSPVVSNISTVAKEGGAWERLEIAECKAQYVACGGLKKHRSVVLVIDKPGGWIRNDIWQLNETEAEFWDQHIPSTKPNHLFFDSQCAMVAAAAEDSNGQFKVYCVNNCANALGANNSGDYFYFYDAGFDVDLNYYPFFDSDALYVVNETSGDIPRYYHTMTSGLRQDSFDLNVTYCLAEPLENICQIGLSPIVLLGVALCVFAKTITAVVVTIVLNRPEHKPLVTLGDAVASFIEHPDLTTVGLCTVDQKQFRTATRQNRARPVPGPRRWTEPQQRWAAAIPIPIWLISYALFASGITTCAILLHEGLLMYNFLGSFLASDNSFLIPIPFSLIQGVLLANSPQLLLSFCYLAYNNLFTRLQMAKEWARFGEGYNSLRVTEPRGQQYSTYRLQLPYKYSIPLIVASAALHWLVSNTIFVFVSTGGYFGTTRFNVPYGEGGDPSLPANTAVAVQYSLTSLVVLITVSSVLVTIPLILAFKKLPSNITQPGSNSLAISAACHASTISRASRASATADGFPSSHLENTPVRTRSSANSDTDSSSQGSPRKSSLWRSWRHSRLILWFLENRIVGEQDGDEDEDDDDDNAQGLLRKLTQSRLRWGVISMPDEWHDEYGHDGPVEHLGFGVREDQPKSPVLGHMYA